MELFNSTSVAGNRLPCFEAGQQALHHDRLQAVGERRADEIVFLAREELENAGERLFRIAAVNRTQHQVTCFRRLDGRQHGFLVTQLADHDAVRILPDDKSQGFREIGHVDADFPLRDDALLRLEGILDRDPRS